ncbi:unnamed protein product [Euphydryas editha]|uniref:DUF7869 domain-containing protein n=1 Tax=Euphydryas editha TaxID=104508 RepID=A0AAU9UA64_EUPED|nr:unnamed protein product [Euphydryas editha]
MKKTGNTRQDNTGITKIRLVADGCGGQNKNSILISMCCKWLVENIDVKVIEIIFPIIGHSFMPADIVFGIIEKKLCRNEVILDPKEISDIITENTTLRKISTDCPVYDRKTVRPLPRILWAAGRRRRRGSEAGNADPFLKPAGRSRSIIAT